MKTVIVLNMFSHLFAYVLTRLTQLPLVEQKNTFGNCVIIEIDIIRQVVVSNAELFCCTCQLGFMSISVALVVLHYYSNT